LFQQIKGTLNKQADILESLHRNVVRQMEVQVRSLDKLTKGLEENLKFNHSSLNESIRLILLEVAVAQDYLNVTASKEIKKVNVYLPSLMMKVPNHLYVLGDTYTCHT
jgi:hypothetical protein